jgi:DNA-binding transcriptional LysR family regulator
MEQNAKLRNAAFSGRASTVDLQHLRYALTASEYGSFRRAAEVLLLRQSTLSRRIRQMEERIQIVVFERSSGGIRTTEAGRHFLRMARSILEQMDALVMDAYSAGRGEAGRLAIGFYTSLSAGNLRATLVDYAERFPQIYLGMVESSRASLFTALRNGTLDIIIVTGDASLGDNNALLLWSERTLLALPGSHSLVDREAIYWTDLRGETVLLNHCDLGREFEDLLMSKLVSPDDKPKIERHDVSRGIINSLVSVGFGVSFAIESDLGATFSSLVYRELRDGTGPSRIGYSAHWRSDNDNAALVSFLKLLRERYPVPSA